MEAQTDTNMMVRDLIDSLEFDQQIMARGLAPVEGCHVLDGTAWVLAKIENDGSTTGYVNHSKTGDVHTVRFVGACGASRWSRRDCASIIQDAEITVSTGRLVPMHWHDAYTAQMDKNADLLANLYQMV
jgi:hypothetical protein